MMRPECLVLSALLGSMASSGLGEHLFSGALSVTALYSRYSVPHAGVLDSSAVTSTFYIAGEVHDSGSMQRRGPLRLSLRRFTPPMEARAPVTIPTTSNFGVVHEGFQAQHAEVRGLKSGGAIHADASQNQVASVGESSANGSGEERGDSGDDSDSKEHQRNEKGHSYNAGVEADGERPRDIGESAESFLSSSERHTSVRGRHETSDVHWYQIRTNFPPRFLRLQAKNSDRPGRQAWYTILTNFKPHILKLTPEH